MSERRNPKLQGWTLSETLVMMIIAGIVFVSVMDGITLFNRYASLKTGQIVGNMRLWEGYYILRDLTVAADSVSTGEAVVRLFREGEPVADLFETDSLLVARHGLRTDTLMSQISEPKLSGTLPDTVLITILNQNGNPLILSFPVVPPVHKRLIKNLEEQEARYEYE